MCARSTGTQTQEKRDRNHERLVPPSRQVGEVLIPHLRGHLPCISARGTLRDHGVLSALGLLCNDPFTWACAVFTPAAVGLACECRDEPRDESQEVGP
jgi:hypothetical protein